jgi:hypothetical protein
MLRPDDPGRRPRFAGIDGFHLLSGLLAVVGAPIMLAMGAPAGWSFLILAAGLIVLVTQWSLFAGITFESIDPVNALLSGIGTVCIGLAVVYLTRAADDLPTVFPGFDADSERFRLIPGVVLLMLGAVAVGRALASIRPRRAARGPAALPGRG